MQITKELGSATSTATLHSSGESREQLPRCFGEEAPTQGESGGHLQCGNEILPSAAAETSTMAEKEMRNAVDECCRKTKLPVPQNENICP